MLGGGQGEATMGIGNDTRSTTSGSLSRTTSNCGSALVVLVDY